MFVTVWRSADHRSMDVVVQPSVSWMTLNDKIKSSGLFFPVDPGPSVSESIRRG
jgi:FAD/FMN-containing dehydrogenase